ncbi:MAG: PAS domain S-box protein, partial [Nitrospinaceae bacterium]|nr:PAS domain S-box protein [Nitrospinaceae bacterium]NIR57458.1 PAS domain S-box protein [Nitrospinaceae bacterium]NIS87925.1 PAS domain S-box protein [Nitrospinaceae bacterium]NIT84793.1 PAS domain S-box protein [Nitrospinaceae bacterium]NIU46969.1 PAS domain S-box protein [Nitrospinaceae bacterium]
ILGLDPQTCLGRPLKSVFESDLLETLVARLAKNQGRPLSLNRELTLPGGGQIHARISASPVFDNTSGQIGTVLILQDLTRMKDLEEEAQRNQRLRATGE